MRRLPILRNLLTTTALAALFPVFVAIADPHMFSAAAQMPTTYQSPTVRTLGTMPATPPAAQPVPPAPGMSQDQGTNADQGIADHTLQPVSVGNASYVTGGIGDEERNTLQTEKANYNLWITSSSRDGAFLGDTQITISDPRGNRMIDAPAAGPLFYANLPAGRYTVTAASGGQSKTEHVTVGKKGTPVHFVWP